MNLFQITEDHLAELERILPEIQTALMTSPGYGSRSRVQLGKVKEIISSVRWNYGPPSHVEVIGPDEPSV